MNSQQRLGEVKWMKEECATVFFGCASIASHAHSITHWFFSHSIHWIDANANGKSHSIAILCNQIYKLMFYCGFCSNFFLVFFFIFFFSVFCFCFFIRFCFRQCLAFRVVFETVLAAKHKIRCGRRIFIVWLQNSSVPRINSNSLASSLTLRRRLMGLTIAAGILYTRRFGIS